jgi:glycine dehydrogenase
MTTHYAQPNLLDPSDTFVHRHLGPRDEEITAMLAALGYETLDELIDATVPAAIRLEKPLALGPPRGEHVLLSELRAIAGKNDVQRSLIGMGYYDTITPPVIQRNILENPGWYTQYTPYQAEISQGRLEALLNFQTMVAELTGLPLANASLLDEATAAAEAMAMCHRITRGKRNTFYVADDCHPQTIAVVNGRAAPLGIQVVTAPPQEFDLANDDLFGVLLQYPTTDGRIVDYADVVKQARAAGAFSVVATDLLALTLLTPPGEFGADIAVGSAQRFGVPLGYGGPHAAFLATHEQHARQVPGRVVGVTRDAAGQPAYRLAVQTREQHIRREKATSNICTNQGLIALRGAMTMAVLGRVGLREIAAQCLRKAHYAAERIAALPDWRLVHDRPFFHEFAIEGPRPATDVVSALGSRCVLPGVPLSRWYPDRQNQLLVAVTELKTRAQIDELVGALAEVSRG